MTEESPLPGMPEMPPSQPRPPGSGERFTRYRPKVRRLCDVCIFLIHRYGQAAAPYPRSARWRRVTGETTKYVCEQHKETRL